MNDLAVHIVKNSTVIEEMKIVLGGDDGFLLFPTANEITSAKQLQAIHTHVYYEFFFAVKKPITIVTENSSKSYESSVVIVPPNVKHFSCIDKGCDGYRIMVMPSEIKRVPKKTGLLDYVKTDEITAIPLSDEMKRFLLELNEIDFFNSYGRLKGQSILTLLFLEIGRVLKSEGSRLDGNTFNRYHYIDKIDRFVGKNYALPKVTLADLASELYLSCRQTSRIIKKEYDSTFVELINERKMMASTALLKYTTLTIGEIISALGFETENYFFRKFKKKYGITPLKYRKSFISQTTKEVNDEKVCDNNAY